MRSISSSITLALALTVSNVSADTAGAESFIQREHSQLRRLVDSSAPQGQVISLIDAMVDYEELTRRTLGKPCPPTLPTCTNHWDSLRPEQQREVTDLLRRLVEKNIRRNIAKTKNYEVTYRGTKDEGGSLSKVRTEAKSREKPRDPSVQVDYLVVEQGARYRVIDIVTEGSSMMKNYYDQFYRMLKTPSQGYAYLVQKLRDKIAAPDKARRSRVLRRLRRHDVGREELPPLVRRGAGGPHGAGAGRSELDSLRLADLRTVELES